ncbi:MAG: hypothetical protein ACYC0T_07375 [Ramlibacter sp.]
MPTISRFAFEKSYFRPSDNGVKLKAYLPNAGATSVFRFGAMGHAGRIAHGNEHVGAVRGKPVLGYAEVATQVVQSCGLALGVDEPPPLHWNILQWPEDEDAQKALALELALEATFVPA